ncbi:MAG: hypothetical protein IJN13_00375 [Bacilli bacterium]|nr:hypothetical protein [Bacilli bacterium]
MKTYNKHIKSYLKSSTESKKADLQAYFKIPTSDSTIILSDGYSIIALNKCDNVSRKRLNSLDINASNNDILTNTLNNFLITFKNNEFCNKAIILDEIIQDKNKELIQIKNLSTRFDIKRINKIKKLICQNNNAGYFISEKDDKAICITGKYGYAYLLGCVNY